MNISYKHFEILKALFQIQDNSFLNKVFRYFGDESL